MRAQDKMGVRVRPAERRDAAALLRAHADSRGLHAGWVEPFDNAAMFRVWLAATQGAGARKVALLAECEGALIGVVNLNEIVRGPFLSCYLGYYALAGADGRSLAGGGRMTEAVRLGVAHAFGALGLHRVEANIQPGNLRSIALVRRLGFRLEGYSPAYLRIGGAWRDHERWALVAEDAGMDVLGQR
jgi:ribosomal-protein-alanine N-acetyltransferase